MDKKEKDISVGDSLVHNFDMINTSIFTPKLFVILLIAVVLGLGSGYLLSKRGAVVVNKQERIVSSSDKVEKGTVVGSNDTKTFKDTAEGVLKGGGIDGEGAYHLVRPGGDSQNVYLTSSLVDLLKFLNRKIKVWGETQKAERAGWLMDAGRVEVLQ